MLMLLFLLNLLYFSFRVTLIEHKTFVAKASSTELYEPSSYNDVSSVYSKHLFLGGRVDSPLPKKLYSSPKRLPKCVLYIFFRLEL